VADVVGQDDEVARGVEQLAGAKENVCKLRRKELASGASGTVQDQNGVGDIAAGVFFRLAEGCVVQAEFGQRLAGLEVEVMRDVVAFGGCGLGR